MQGTTTVRRPRPGRHRLRASVLAVVLTVAATVVVTLATPTDVAAQDGVSMLVSDVDDATRPSVSQDGRWVVFEGSLDGRRTVFRTDRNSGETVELSPVPESVRSGDTVMPRLSADGCVVVAITEIPYDLFRDDDRLERWDVYRLVVPECGGQPAGWELVSTGHAGTAIDGVFTDAPPALSGSGAIVAYVRQLDGAPEGVGTIMVVDITVPVGEVGREEEVAGMPVETPNRAYLYRGAREPELSENGRHLAFVADTTASAPLPGWAAGPVPGEAATAHRSIHWMDDFLPDLSEIRKLSYRFDLVLVSAVWMHLPPTHRERAFWILTELLAPSGMLVITLRRGPGDGERQFYEVSKAELDSFARHRAVMSVPLADSTRADQLNRPDVWWETAVYLPQKPSNT